MARKIRLAYIQNDVARKTTFKKRKAGIVKKLDELTTLCAIEACLIMYSVYDPLPFVWPSNDEARRLIARFRSFSEVDQGRRKVNQESYMRQRLEKMEEQLRKVQGENRQKEITHVMFQSLVDRGAALSMLDMGGYGELSVVVDKRMMEAQRMMEIRSREEDDSVHPQGSVGGQNPVLSHEFLSPIQSSNLTFPPPPPPTMEFPPSSIGFPQGGAGGSGGVSGGQHFVLSHQYQYMPPNQYGRFQSSCPNFSMPNMMFPPPPPPQGGAGGSGGGGNGGVGDQQLVLSHHDEFMPPNQYGMMIPPPIMNYLPSNMTFPPPPPKGGAGPSGGGQQLALSHHEFMPDPNQYGRVQSPSPRFSPPPNMTPSMSFPPNDMAYMDPNTGMPYPSNQPMFPYYHNDDIGPHDSSFR